MLLMRIYLFNNAGFSFLDLFHRYSHSERDSHLEISQQLLRDLKHASTPPFDPTVFTYGCMLLMASNSSNAMDKACVVL